MAGQATIEPDLAPSAGVGWPGAGLRVIISAMGATRIHGTGGLLRPIRDGRS
jgi:hypothetical protein